MLKYVAVNNYFNVMAEIHVIGEILNGKLFPKQNLFCKWNLQHGNNWKLISGKKEGQTHVVSSEFNEECRWCFPIDLHLATKGVQGWPKIFVEVYHLDWWGRSHLFGYGYVAIPTSPGNYRIECFTWRLFGSLKERFVQFFLGGGPHLKNPDMIFSANDRYKLNTESMGIVTFNFNIVLRSFNKFGVEY